MASTTTATKISAAGNCHMAAVPYPGRGHINPMLNLCRQIASKSPNLTVTFIVTEEWFGFLTNGSEPEPPANFRFGVIPQVVPSEVGRAADIISFVEAVFTKMEGPVERLLDQLEPPATVLVYDVFMLWPVGVANRRNIPAAALCTASASASASMFNVLSHYDLFVQNGHVPLDVSERGSEVVDYIPGIPPTAISDFPEIFNGRAILKTILQSVAAIPKCQFLILPSTPELEGPAVEALKSKFSSTTNILPVGPLIPYSYLPSSSSSDSPSYIHWLDSQPPQSVLYVSMGSFLSTSTTQLDEIIAGIKDSGVNYLLVTRGEEGVKERGYLVRWCDQLRVLSHCAVGGFWSHCGWNSTSEAMYAGVPMLTFPIMWDQLLNCKMAVDDFKVGMRVKSSGEEQLVMREEIGKIVREFMSGEGRSNIAAMAERIGEICRIAVAPGGSSACHLAFVHEISRP